MKRYWLIKSEPEEYSIDDLRRDKQTAWDRVRNYQARNYLREMQKGDLCLFYHSNADPTGVAGIAEVSKLAYPEAEQFNPKSDYFDPKATKENPRWFSPDLKFVEKFAEIVPLEALRKKRGLEQMILLKRGTRLSVQSVSAEEFSIIQKLVEAKPKSRE